MLKKTMTKTTRRKMLAAKVVSTGKPLSKIAEDLGVSRATASSDFNAPETKGYIRALLAKHDMRIDAMVTKALDAIDGGLVAMKDDREDHAARLRSVQEAARVLELREGKSKDDAKDVAKPLRFDGTLEELLQLYKRTTGGDYRH